METQRPDILCAHCNTVRHGWAIRTYLPTVASHMDGCLRDRDVLLKGDFDYCLQLMADARARVYVFQSCRAGGTLQVMHRLNVRA